jgi:hypothetical protein
MTEGEAVLYEAKTSLAYYVPWLVVAGLLPVVAPLLIVSLILPLLILNYLAKKLAIRTKRLIAKTGFFGRGLSMHEKA